MALETMSVAFMAVRDDLALNGFQLKKTQLPLD